MKHQTNNRIGVPSSMEAGGMNLARNESATRSLKVHSGLKAGPDGGGSAPDGGTSSSAGGTSSSACGTGSPDGGMRCEPGVSKTTDPNTGITRWNDWCYCHP
jgi:hypothetical protein